MRTSTSENQKQSIDWNSLQAYHSRVPEYRDNTLILEAKRV